MQTDGSIENFSCDMFDDDEVHKIAILDLRMLNIDRNEGNILVQTVDEDIEEFSLDLSISDRLNPKIKRRLIPIDHGMSIPDSLEVCSFDLIWLSFSQAERPFSTKSLEYIKSIDIMKDIKNLEETFKFRPICLRNMRISSTLLKKAAEKNLTLAQIGQILCRPDDDEEQPSLLETIVEKARTIANMMA